ncbi:MAG: ABC transporter ATP-binding protein [Planctomycetota bacterium]|nr:ABC transporter ATP-binding protein [Planctomycetota bacterium]
MSSNRSSRIRFGEYRGGLRTKKREHKERKVVTWHSQERSAHRTRSFKALFGVFIGMLRPYRKSMFVALGCLTIATMLALVPPAVTKFAVDQVFQGLPLPQSLIDLIPGADSVPQTPRDQLLILVGIVVVVAFASTMLGIVGRWRATKTVKRLQSSLRKDVFDHASRLPLHRVQELTSGGATSLIREDAGGVADLVFAMIYNPWRAIIQLLGSLLILAWVDWRLLVGAIALFPMIWYTHRTWIGRIRPMYRDIRLQRQEIDSHATESFGGMRVVRGFARTRSESTRFTTGNHLMIRKELYVWWWARGVELAWSLLIPLASAALLWFGGVQVLDGSITTGDLVMFLAYLAMLFGPIEVLANSATMFQTNLAGLDRVLDIIDEEREFPDPPDAREIGPAEVRGHITMEDVSFSYPGSEEGALEDVGFEVPPGSVVALVGRSGAGKTTCCNLVARFYDPERGRILLDGRDIRTITLESYRRLLGIVEQDVFLFDGTIRSNIAYGKRGARDEEVREAARLAAAVEFIDSLPEGWDTVIGERGFKLSGGQRQRLAIARAILADPKILILDEATSNLDTENEKFIQQGLAELMKGRTSFVIAHRLSTIMHADLIVVLENGRVIETGHHDELMERSGPYRKMVILQSESKE